MHEGWLDKNYLIFFEPKEADDYTKRYAVDSALPGYSLHGIIGWDDFLLKDAKGGLSTIPTVPMDTASMKPFAHVIDPHALQPDERFRGKIKWYIKPIVFGGDPQAGPNMTWLSLEQHVAAVLWWNQLYRDLKSKK